MLLFFLFVTAGLAMAQRSCIAASPSLTLPSCTDSCFSYNGCASSGCPCASNLKGWCEMNASGPSNWFSRWGFCLSINCPDDGDLTYLMKTFTEQCEGTVGGPLTNDTVPAPLRDWMPTTATGVPVVSPSGSQSVATLTGVAPTVSSTSDVTSRSPETTGTTSTIATTAENAASVLDDQASSSSRAASTSAPASHDSPKPALNLAAIIGVAVGGAILLALIIGLVCFFMRRRKRKEPKRSVSPPMYEPAAEKQAYDKPELDGQALEHQYSEVGVGAPVVYAELDAGSPVSPVREPVHLSAHERRARAAQNF